MSATRPLRIGITCYPSVGGSGILASELGEELAARGHEIHFISYERPFRIPEGPKVFFHQVVVNSYDLFKYPDYTLPLSVKMAEVSREHALDVLHVHYAVPHATAAVLARAMLHGEHQLRIITTLHGTDTTLLGRDPGYGPAIRHALEHSDAITTVSEFMRTETVRLLGVQRPIEVIHNFFEPHPVPPRRAELRRELGVAAGEALLLHLSNLRPLKRMDLLLDTAVRLKSRLAFKLVILAGADSAPLAREVARLGLAGHVLIRERVTDIENYLQAADLGLFTSEVESFCLSILELMSLGCPSAAFAVGGIPEVTISGETGFLSPFGDMPAFVAGIEVLLRTSYAAGHPQRVMRNRRECMRSNCRSIPQDCSGICIRLSQFDRVHKELDGADAIAIVGIRHDGNRLVRERRRIQHAGRRPNDAHCRWRVHRVRYRDQVHAIRRGRPAGTGDRERDAVAEHAVRHHPGQIGSGDERLRQRGLGRRKEGVPRDGGREGHRLIVEAPQQEERVVGR